MEVNKKKNNLLALIDNFPLKKIAVWGDYILDEYLYGTDPTVRNHAPSTPVIQSPADAGQVDTTSPELVITNSTDADGDRLSYEFEVFSDPGLSTMVSSGSNIAEGTGQTSWTPPRATQ